MIGKGTILSLCDFTGNWSETYREAGYEVVRIDLQHGQDVRLLKFPGRVHGILAAPPCTHFSRAGASHWKNKGEDAILEGLAIVDACLRLITVCQPDWWALENPIGRLKDYIGPPPVEVRPVRLRRSVDEADLALGRLRAATASVLGTGTDGCGTDLVRSGHDLTGPSRPDGEDQAWFASFSGSHDLPWFSQQGRTLDDTEGFCSRFFPGQSLIPGVSPDDNLANPAPQCPDTSR
jgi:hypothetical protein